MRPIAVVAMLLARGIACSAPVLAADVFSCFTSNPSDGGEPVVLARAVFSDPAGQAGRYDPRRLLSVASSDRIVRNEQEYDRIRRYIEGNPVNAALVASPEG